MRVVLIALTGALILAAGVACGSAEEESAPAAAQVADLSQFPTPTRSQAEPRPTSPPPTAQTQPSQNEGETAETEPMPPEEIQRLMQRLQSGELSEEEAREAIQRIRDQLGGGQGGPPFGAAGGSVAVGTIESVGDSAITVKTELASITANLGEDTDIRITAILEPAALTNGAQVMVVSERVEGRALARAITIIPEEQAGFGDAGGQRGLGGLGGAQAGQGGFGGGQGGQGGLGGAQAGQGGFGGAQGAGGARPLFGTLENVTDAGFTLETQQGPLPITMDGESIIVQTRQGTIGDLEAGMQVRVIGPANDDGRIDARSVLATPEGVEDIRGFGGARGLGGGN